MRKSLIYVYIAGAFLVAAVILAIYVIGKPKEEVTVTKASVSGIETMVRLCTVDIYNEVPVRDTINNKVVFAVQKQTGSISFDLDGLQTDDSGDTIRVTLPREIIELRESTDDNAWRVIDTKNLRWFGSDRLTDNEENMLKSRIRSKAVSQLYANGTVARARSEAVKQLKAMLQNIYSRPVIVSNPTPQGNPG